MSSGNVIAITGMPRTGSTLLRQVLAASKQVAMPHDVPEGFFGNLAKSYWSAWKVSRHERKDWAGDDSFNTDIKEVNPWISPGNICAAADLDRLRSPYRDIVSHMLNATGNECQHVGIKNVRDIGPSMVAMVRLMSELYGVYFKAIHTVRHPFSQIRSECNAVWCVATTNAQAIRLFFGRLKKWKAHMHHMSILVSENPNTCIVHYEDRLNDFRKAVAFAGLEWCPEMDQLLSGPKLNPSNIRFPLNEECFQAAHEAYMNCDFIRCGHGPVCLDSIEELVR